MLETIEPTFAKAVDAITASAELPKQTKAQWCSALRGLVRCFNLPLESIPARFSAVRARMLALRSPPFDWTRKTLANTTPKRPCSGSGGRRGSAATACR
jgi:hypothetical protein